jgi:hypothetical protein
MRKTTLALTAVAILSACGGGGDGVTPPPAAPAADLDARLTGTWPGTLTITPPAGIAPSSAPATLQVTVVGRTATISQVCPSGTGTVAATGSDRSAAWSGSLVCPAVALPGLCASVVATLSSATGTLSADGLTLTVDAAGSGTGCFTTLNFTMRFVGAK